LPSPNPASQLYGAPSRFHFIPIDIVVLVMALLLIATLKISVMMMMMILKSWLYRCMAVILAPDNAMSRYDNFPYRISLHVHAAIQVVDIY